MSKLKISSYNDASEMCRILAVNGNKVWLKIEYEFSSLKTITKEIYYVCFEEEK